MARTGQGVHDPQEALLIAGQPHGLLTRPLPGGGAAMVAQDCTEADRTDTAFLQYVLGAPRSSPRWWHW
ncbi:hypothetical protein GCM10010174_38040 [Kutzneria viridogrisea]|uniref:Two-component system sensor histidine kinase MprB n=1 Tax=Kutzneria viridogrisea TaxID=47990 RepID=A0ABR6BYK4_9PSEU|nr:hypothetical protein [Kutzneria albida]MBA8931991.1 two-component system sensor histidine kinase MprB [Kutzneria viridogrisea]